MSQSNGWNLKLVPLLERCVEGSEVTRYLPSHLCPAGDAVCLTVCFVDSWVPVQSSVHNRLWGSSSICPAFRGGVEKWIHIKTQVWKKTLLWSLWIYIWVLKKCSPVQWCYSFIHAFSIFTRGYWEADVLAQTKQDRETHSHSHLWAIFSLQFTWHVFLRMRGNWSTWRKPAHGSARKALKRIWIWPLLSVTDLRKPEVRITVSSTPPPRPLTIAVLSTVTVIYCD